jgi:hypothetical protein
LGLAQEAIDMLNANSAVRGGGLMFVVQPNGLSRIAQIYKALDALRKRMEALAQQLQASNDPSERMEIRHEMVQLQEMMEALRRELLMLNDEKQRHKPSAAQVLLLPSGPDHPQQSDQADDGGIYHPPGA